MWNVDIHLDFWKRIPPCPKNLPGSVCISTVVPPVSTTVSPKIFQETTIVDFPQSCGNNGQNPLVSINHGVDFCVIYVNKPKLVTLPWNRAITFPRIHSPNNNSLFFIKLYYYYYCI